MSSRSSSVSSDDRKKKRYPSGSSRSRSRSPEHRSKHKKRHHHKRKHHKHKHQYDNDERSSRRNDSDYEESSSRSKPRQKSRFSAHVKKEPESDGQRVRVKREQSEDRSGWVMKQQNRERQKHERHREERRQRSPFPQNNPQDEAEEDKPDKDKPDFGLSGKLTEETNTFRGVVIKYSEPPEARKPRKRWRFYPFKGEQSLPVLHISRQSAYLLGRDRKIADMPIDHPSCSKQHAVLQYRLVEYERANGMPGRQVRPYIIDLDSANGTYLNNKRIDARRYVELQEKDVLKFGFSTREYVLLHDKTSTEELSDGSESDDPATYGPAELK